MKDSTQSFVWYQNKVARIVDVTPNYAIVKFSRNSPYSYPVPWDRIDYLYGDFTRLWEIAVKE